MARWNIQDYKNFFSLEKLRQDKRVLAFLVCLIISSALWFLNALSKDYETTLAYPVRYTNMPDKRFLANNPPDEFELKVKAHGFSLLRNKLNLSFAPLILDVKRLVSNASQAGPLTYNVTTSRLIGRISSQVSNEINITEISPASFILILDSLESKQVKVRANIEINYASQYNISSPIKITPEFVTATGPGGLLDSLSVVETESRKFNGVKHPVEATLNLKTIEKISLSPKKVKINVPVEEFTEKKLSVPVTIVNKPEGITIKLFPSEVEVSFLVSLSNYAKITENDFQFSIPYSAITTDNSEIPIQLSKQPEFIRDIRFTPQSIEFLIEKN